MKDFQTKDDTRNELLCDYVKPESIEEFYTSCDSCHKWYDYKTSKDKTKVVRCTRYETIDFSEIALADNSKEG